MAEITIDQFQDILDPTLQHAIIETAVVDGVTLYAIQQTGEFEGALSIAKLEGGRPVMVIGDVLGSADALEADPAILSAFSGGAEIVADLQVIYRDDPTIAGAAIVSQAELNNRVHGKVLWGVGNQQMNSATLSPPETNGGRLACAWSVNRIVKFALGKPIGGGLSTYNMVKILKENDKVTSSMSASPGTIIISPTSGRNVGHVGIIGQSNRIYSNSSSQGMWIESHTLDRWVAYYKTNKGLPVLFYDLSPQRFPQANA